MSLTQQIVTLLILAIPISSIAWTITHEEIFRETRDWCLKNSKTCRTIYERKFFYLFTCEYCFSHYITIAFLLITDYKLMFTDWRGYLVGGFSLVWIANIYMSLFGFVRLGIKKEKIELDEVEKEVRKS